MSWKLTESQLIYCIEPKSGKK